MKVVIEISEDRYNEYKNYPSFMNYAEHLIKNGTPLESVLDTIKAEIEEQVLERLSDGGDDWLAAEKVNECLDIIDKYKKDGEVEE